MGWKRVRAGFVALVALATMSAGAVTAAPAEAASTFTGVSKPTISGTRTVGKTLTAKRDTSTTPKAQRVSYQWLRNGSKISGAKSSTYKLRSADQGKKISVKVCYAKAKYTTRCVTSGRTAKIAAAAVSSSCTIKGNISSSGEKIYHVKGQRFYNVTQIDLTKGERWFCSESAARKAGWRKSKV